MMTFTWGAVAQWLERATDNRVVSVGSYVVETTFVSNAC